MIMMHTLESLVMEVNKMQQGDMCIYCVSYSRRISPFQIVFSSFIFQNP